MSRGQCEFYRRAEEERRRKYNERIARARREENEQGQEANRQRQEANRERERERENKGGGYLGEVQDGGGDECCVDFQVLLVSNF